MPPANPASRDAVAWSAVLAAEKTAIQARRGTNSPPADLTALAISGGGIRSATFSLGVLESLKEHGLLPQFDYLSTVSGGGYIGSWLSANCLRKPGWLEKNTPWTESIRHLRRYSNYLSPKVGFFSADSWTMAAIWSRNSLLVQATILLLIAAVLLFPRLLFLGFVSWPATGIWRAVNPALLVLAVLVIGASLQRIMWGDRAKRVAFLGLPGSPAWVQALAVFPLLANGYFTAAVMWHQVRDDFAAADTYTGLLRQTLEVWFWPLALVLLSLYLLAFSSMRTPAGWKELAAALLSPPVCTAALHAQLCGVLLLLHNWAGDPSRGQWQAFIWGPALVLYAFALTAVLLMGLLGRQSSEAAREWWSRLGALLGIYGFGWLLAAVASAYGPLWTTLLVSAPFWASALSGGGWLVTTLGGLLAGKSASTGGKEAGSGKLEFVAKIAPFAFIGGLFLAVSSAAHLLLLKIDDQAWFSSGQLIQDHWRLLSAPGLAAVGWTFLAAAVLLGIFAARVDINEFSMNAFYRNRLARCYLGATRSPNDLQDPRRPQAFTGFDPNDDLPLAGLAAQDYRGPLHLVNCALNLGGSSDLEVKTRHAASFTLSPLHCGSPYIVRRAGGAGPIGYIPTPDYAGDGSPTLAQAVSVSGAAASPNMGFHTSPVVAFLLTLFNVRLGWWFPNPAGPAVRSPSPWFSLRYLFKELLGGADAKAPFLMLSDGGHFENLALYELLRRRCRVIVALDAECDPKHEFGSLGALIRMAETDLNVRVNLNVDALRLDPETKCSAAHFATGRILYPDADPGALIYLKASLTGQEDTAIRQYKSGHPDFPHETTGDQFYGEDQFESYRRLGRHIAASALAHLGAGGLLSAAPGQAQSVSAS